MAKRKTAEETDGILAETETADITAEAETLPESSISLKTAPSEAAVTEKKYIYVGASRNGIAEGTVFNEIPEDLNKPFLRELCINVAELGRFRKRAAVTTSREAFLLRKSKEI